MKTRLSFLAPALCALVLWALWAFLPKLAVKSMPAQSVLFFDAFGYLLVALVVALYLGRRLERSGRAVVISAAGSFITVVATLAYFYALKNGPVAVIVTLTGMYPVICTLLAHVILKEKINRKQWC